MERQAAAAWTGGQRPPRAEVQCLQRLPSLTSCCPVVSLSICFDLAHSRRGFVYQIVMSCDVLSKSGATMLFTGLSACLLRRRYLIQQRWWQPKRSSRTPDATQHNDASLVGALKALPIFELARDHQAPATVSRLSQQQSGSFDSLLHQVMLPATGDCIGHHSGHHVRTWRQPQTGSQIKHLSTPSQAYSSWRLHAFVLRLTLTPQSDVCADYPPPIFREYPICQLH